MKRFFFQTQKNASFSKLSRDSFREPAPERRATSPIPLSFKQSACHGRANYETGSSRRTRRRKRSPRVQIARQRYTRSMRPAILSLVLLGTTARGCFFRGDAPKDSASRIHLGNLRGGVTPREPRPETGVSTIRQMRADGKKALKDACSDNAAFQNCHRDEGSAIQLEECLEKRSRTISGTCLKGIEAW